MQFIKYAVVLRSLLELKVASRSSAPRDGRDARRDRHAPGGERSPHRRGAMPRARVQTEALPLQFCPPPHPARSWALTVSLVLIFRLRGDRQQLQQQMMDVDAQGGVLGAGHGGFAEHIRWDPRERASRHLCQRLTAECHAPSAEDRRAIAAALGEPAATGCLTRVCLCPRENVCKHTRVLVSA